MTEFKRNKAAVIASGLDPGLRRLHQAHGIRASRKKAVEKACERYQESLEHVERYWAAIQEAVESSQEEGAA